MKKKLGLIVACLLACTQVLSADPLMQYNYFDAAYQWTKDVEDGGDSGNGLDTKFSYTPIENFAVEAGYNYMDVSDLNTDANVFKYGVASWYSLCETMDLVGRIGGLHSRLDVDGDKANDNGVYAGAQLRTMLSDTMEGNLDLLYTKVDSEDTFTYGLAGLKTLADNLALKVGTTIDEDYIMTVTGGIRLTM